MAAPQHFNKQGGPCFPPFPHQEAVTSLAQSQNNFTRDLYTKLARGKEGNLFFSPFSIMAALGMTYRGATGNTKEEMRSAMHLGQNEDDDTHSAFCDILTDIKKESVDYELRTSNTAYVSNQMKLLDDYAITLREKYLSSSKVVDFDDGEGVRQEINSLVEKDTNSRITDLIPSGVLNSLTRMVLVNAIYFKGLWEHQFDEAHTFDEDFWTSEKGSVKVPMMHIKKHFRMFHLKDLGAMVLAMDYKGSRLSMVFVLPDEKEGLQRVESKMAEMNLKEIDQRLRSVEVEVTIPKFKLEESIELVDTLKQLGIEDLFSDAACDLSGITGGKELFVSNVFHKAFLEVNEKGSEAAAATAMVAQTRMLIRPIPPFVADRPFLFFIRDQNSGLIHFAGRLVDPKSAI
ncbi:hypothetical protein Pmani_010213 [Petrolisthes manimaculis]|uniref:Serpin domain-containing protein n=1 Tax=Petrolisthes manimaculis TaxID=1843537 RepID=A0AAE1Q3J1_9EUCA|nr:hypothetical protein Pmani_010213 [Petrolisthes manimaculis]